MISNRQNAAINLAKAYHLLATATGDTWHITNATEHLDVACDNDAENFDFEAVRSALDQITDLVICQGAA